MDAEKLVFEKYQRRGITEGGEVLLQHADAINFIKDCERLGLTILGMDFYTQVGNQIVEILGPADYSSLSGHQEGSKRSVAAALQLIQEGLPDGAEWVSFVVE